MHPAANRFPAVVRRPTESDDPEYRHVYDFVAGLPDDHLRRSALFKLESFASHLRNRLDRGSPQLTHFEVVTKRSADPKVRRDATGRDLVDGSFYIQASRNDFLTSWLVTGALSEDEARETLAGLDPNPPEDRSSYTNHLRRAFDFVHFPTGGGHYALAAVTNAAADTSALITDTSLQIRADPNDPDWTVTLYRNRGEPNDGWYSVPCLPLADAMILVRDLENYPAPEEGEDTLLHPMRAYRYPASLDESGPLTSADHARKWILALRSDGLEFHYDDDPATVMSGGYRIFTNTEASYLRHRMEQVFDLIDPFSDQALAEGYRP